MNKRFLEVGLKYIKAQSASLNNKLVGEQVFIYDTGTKHWVMVLISTENQNIRAQFDIKIDSMRDICLAKAMLHFIERTRVPKKSALCALPN